MRTKKPKKDAAPSIEGFDPLPNPQHEKFAQAVAMGESPSVAYVTAGYSAKGARSNGYRLAESATVASRISFLSARRKAVAVAIGFDFDAAAIDRELTWLGSSTFADIIEAPPQEWDDHDPLAGEKAEAAKWGAPRVKPMHRWPERFMRAIQSIEVKRHLVGSEESQHEVELLKFKLHPKLGAIDLLRKHRGYDEKKDASEIGIMGVLVLPPLDGPAVPPDFPDGQEVPEAFTVLSRPPVQKLGGHEALIADIKAKLAGMRGLLPRPPLAHQIAMGQRDPIVVKAHQPGDAD